MLFRSQSGPLESMPTPTQRTGIQLTREDSNRRSQSRSAATLEGLFEALTPTPAMHGAFPAIRSRMLPTHRLVVEESNFSSAATTPGIQQASPPVAPLSLPIRNRVFGQDLIIEPPSPSPPIAGPSSVRPHSSPNQPRSSSNASDGGGSNRSTGTNNTNTSTSNGGAVFFRPYSSLGAGGNGSGGSGGGPSSSEPVLGRAETSTPDLVFAEIGHGKGKSSEAGPGPNTMRNAWRSVSQSSTSSPHESSSKETETENFSDEHGVQEQVGEHDRGKGKASVQRRRSLDSGREGTILADSSNSMHRGSVSFDDLTALPRNDVHKPSSPIPYLSSNSYTALQRSVYSAFQSRSNSRQDFNSNAVPPEISVSEDDVIVDGRGRSMRRSLRNTLNVAERYANALFLRRSGVSSPTTSSGRASNSNSGVRQGDSGSRN